MGFKVGDRVKANHDCNGTKAENEYVIVDCDCTGCNNMKDLGIGHKDSGGWRCHCEAAWTLVEPQTLKVGDKVKFRKGQEHNNFSNGDLTVECEDGRLCVNGEDFHCIHIEDFELAEPEEIKVVTKQDKPMGFKVGDRVKQTENCTGTIEGTVYEVHDAMQNGATLGCSLWIWGEGKEDHCSCPMKWELVRESSTNKPNKTIMQKLTPMLKKLLDPKAQALYKAGYLNGDLELTEEGTSALNTIVFETNKDALVDLAKEVIAEDKKK